MLLWVDLSVRKRSSSAAGNKKMRKGENDGNLKDMSSGVVVDDTGRILMASSKRIATIVSFLFYALVCNFVSLS
ncbi:hypothetical protein V6N13_076541 [Hibiscus sabdariffa]